MRVVFICTEEDFEKLKDFLKKVPRIFSFRPFADMNADLEQIKKISSELFEKEIERYGNKENITFRVKTRRPQKKFPLTSLEVNMEVGGPISEKYGIKVDLKRSEEAHV
ncbi:hypothetical protein MMMIC1C10_18420 [Methanococcus maripaludis]